MGRPLGGGLGPTGDFGGEEMLKMCRKAFGGLVLLGVGAYLLTGTSLGSYAKTAYAQTVGYFKGQIPIEFQIDRAKQLVGDLVPEIHKAARDIAVEEVRVGRVKDEIARAESELREQQVAILALRDKLKETGSPVSIGGQKVDREDVERDLSRRFKAFKRVSENVDQRKGLLVSREAKLSAARETYQELIETRKELESEIESLDSQQKILDARKVAQRILVDEGRFEHARAALDEIKERLAVEQKMIEQQGFLSEPINVDELPPANLTEEIDSFFGVSAKETST